MHNNNLHEKIQDDIINIIGKVESGDEGHLNALVELEAQRKLLEQSLELIKGFKDDFRNEIASEADKYGSDGYRGFKITLMKGRVTFKYDDIPEIKEAEKHLKERQDIYKTQFLGLAKNTTITTRDEEGALMWIDNDSEAHYFPEYNESKSFIKVEPIKIKKPKK